jgi:tRNA nucleotidyltransferase/poly(A) polymerase
MSLLKEYPDLATVRDLVRSPGTKVYLVGGFLRDYFLGRTGMDFDFAVSKGALRFSRRFSRKIKGAFVVLDKERGCARVVKKENGRLLTFDFADFRVRTLRGDLSHRDFTINAMAVDLARLHPAKPLAKQLIDPCGGAGDLRRKTIKMISAKSFREDPLRLLRAFSLKAALGFQIDKATISQIRKDKALLSDTSPERVRDELFKILDTPCAAPIFKAMDRIGLLRQVVPQIHIMEKVTQGGYHHLDVWPHSLETLAQLEKVFEEFKNDEDVAPYLMAPFAGSRRRFALIKLAALLHDIGKPQTKRKEQGRVSFHGHEHVGKNIVRSVARMLKLSTRERYALEDMVRWHLRPGYLSNFKSPSERAVFRYLRDTKQEAASTLLLSLADQRSTRGPLTSEEDQRHHEKIVRSVLRRYFEKTKEKPFVRLMTGHDLIKTLKLKPSPVFAKILAEVEEKQILGKIKTKKEALELAKKIAGES